MSVNGVARAHVVSRCWLIPGTPRQGALAPSTRGVIRFSKEVGGDALDGLSTFSHLWILYMFHTNTNFFKVRPHT